YIFTNTSLILQTPGATEYQSIYICLLIFSFFIYQNLVVLIKHNRQNKIMPLNFTYELDHTDYRRVIRSRFRILSCQSERNIVTNFNTLVRRIPVMPNDQHGFVVQGITNTAYRDSLCRMDRHRCCGNGFDGYFFLW